MENKTPRSARECHQLLHIAEDIVAIDSHCHLHDHAFDADREDVLQRAVTLGVRVIVEIGASDGAEGNSRAVKLAEQYPAVFATVGLHPHDAKEATAATLAVIEALAFHQRVVAIGETGLDYHYDHSPRTEQQELFRYFIALARRLRKPLTVHLREAEEDAIAILRAEGAQDVGGVIHCFTSDWSQARRFLDLGFYLSFSGVVTFKNAEKVREVVRKIPNDRFLLETDAPYLAPVPKRGRRNEPAFLLHTAACVAEVRSQHLEQVLRQATQNTLCVFPGILCPELKPIAQGNGLPNSERERKK